MQETFVVSIPLWDMTIIVRIILKIPLVWFGMRMTLVLFAGGKILKIRLVMNCVHLPVWKMDTTNAVIVIPGTCASSATLDYAVPVLVVQFSMVDDSIN